MSNDYWNNLVALTRRTVARAEVVNAILGAIKSGFDLLPSKARLYEQRVAYAVDAGAINAISVTLAYAFTLTDGATLRVKMSNTNNGATVITIVPGSGPTLTSIPVRDYGNNALTGGELAAGTFADLIYNATTATFRVANPNIDVASVQAIDINALTQGTDVDPQNDYAVIYDASAGMNKKVKVSLVADEASLILASQVFGRR